MKRKPFFLNLDDLHDLNKPNAKVDVVIEKKTAYKYTCKDRRRHITCARRYYIKQMRSH